MGSRLFEKEDRTMIAFCNNQIIVKAEDEPSEEVEEVEVKEKCEEGKCSKEDVVSFLHANANPSDESIHRWAEINGLDHEEVEEYIYSLASVYSKFLLGGRANEKEFTEEDADPEELRMGIEIEFEHTSDRETAKRIALDHLAEIPDYYTRLVKMEEEAGVKDV